MNPVVSASYAQFGVDAGGRRPNACSGRASSNGIERSDPVAVETGYCASAYSHGGMRPMYDPGYEPAMRCYPASSRERCVQCSLPCVSRTGEESYACFPHGLAADAIFP